MLMIAWTLITMSAAIMFLQIEDSCLVRQVVKEQQQNTSREVMNIRSTTSTKKLKKTAIVIRTFMPVRRIVLDRIVQIATAIHHFPRFERYDFVVLSDETNQNGTELLIRNFFRQFANVPVPLVYVVTQNKIRREFSPGLERYIQGPLVSGETALDIGEMWQSRLMWQLLAPTFVSFVKAHNYSASWVLEDDVWALGKGQVPILDLFDRWDRAMPTTSGLAAFKKSDGHCPFFAWGRGKHTQPFQDILEEMYGTSDYDVWKKRAAGINSYENWHETNNTKIQRWTCTSDSLYRHSRDFSLYMHEQIQQYGVFRFAEGFQQPLAWKANFSIVDLETLLPMDPTGHDSHDGDDDGPVVGFDRMSGPGVKLKYSDAVDVHLAQKEEGAISLFHEELPKRDHVNQKMK